MSIFSGSDFTQRCGSIAWSCRQANQLAVIIGCMSAAGFLARTAESAWGDDIRFDRDIKPILSDKCFHCHGPDEANRAADLRLDLEEAAKEYAIVEHSTDESEVMARILSTDPESIMPPPESGKVLSTSEQELIQTWIDEGAAWSQHWSFVPPKSPPVPVNQGQQRASRAEVQAEQNPIDSFVRDTQAAKSLAVAPRASREELIRRVTFDLTGLPPTLEQIDDFLVDPSESAYETVVDRLLASPHFGERMAVMWLDAARYGDTSVYHADGPRDMWAWRDTIVNAYNANMPFDKFSIAQLAGDLLPEASLEEKILSGFNRNNGTTDEGGAIAEEYRVEYAVDRVKTTATTWLGLTMECAQCHDHKYDPISQREYYQFYAFFNVSADGGMQTRNGNAAPLLDIPNRGNQAELDEVEAEIALCKNSLEQLRKSSADNFQNWLVDADKSQDVSLPAAYWYTLLNEGKGRKATSQLRSQTPSPTKEQVPAEGKSDETRTKRSTEPAADSNAQKLTSEDSATLVSGTIKGPNKWEDSTASKGLNFAGKTFVDFGDIGDFERDQAFTLSTWIKPTGGIGAAIARMDDGNAFRGYDLYAGASPVSMHIIHSWPDNAVKVTTKKKLPKNKWAHVAATYDGSSKASGIHIYVNGEEWEWSIEQDGLTGSIRTEKSLLLGSRHPGSRFSGVIDEANIFDAALTPVQVKQLANPISQILNIQPNERTEQQNLRLLSHFLRQSNTQYAALEKTESELKQRAVELRKPLTSVMIMSDQAKPRDTFILNRGAYDSPTEEKVTAATPAILPPIVGDQPANRLALAKWLFQRDNPLTARVAINRYWQMLFGHGLVVTPGDFGAQGSFPSHPELLDWLSVEFRQNDWNIKHMLKLMVMSATYQQTAVTGSQNYDSDPENTWLSRGSRFRLQAEFVRDAALQAGGILDLKLGGPGVKPYQPPGLWVEVGLSGKPAFVQDHGEKLYRRSLYTYWKRSAPPPSMQIFDAPTREKCTIRRPTTNTPLQALVLMNDTQFVEAARCLAERTIGSESSDLKQLSGAFRRATSRGPTNRELGVLTKLLAQQREAFRDDVQAAKDLLSIGEHPLPLESDQAELAAWTIVASAILNLDDAVTR